MVSLLLSITCHVWLSFSISRVKTMSSSSLFEFRCRVKILVSGNTKKMQFSIYVFLFKIAEGRLPIVDVSKLAYCLRGILDILVFLKA